MKLFNNWKEKIVFKILEKFQKQIRRMFLTEEGKKLLNRNNDLKFKKVRYLTEEEVFEK
jgi:hypothetical protein